MIRSLLLASIVATGCVGTETGNPSFTAALTFDAHSSDPSRVALRAAQGGAVVREAWLVLGDVRFVDETSCDGPMEPEPHVPGLGAADHAQVGPALVRFELDSSRFCRVGVPFVPLVSDPPAGAPPELVGASIVLLGASAAGAELLLASSLAIEVDVRATAGAFELSSERAGVFLGFDVATWLGGVDIDSGTPEADGRIVIDATRNSALLAAFEASFGRGLELYLDLDEDGVPDAPEPIARGL